MTHTSSGPSSPGGTSDPWDDLPRIEAERQQQYDLEADPSDPDEPHKCVVHRETRSQIQRNGSFVVTEYCERGHVVNHYVDSVL